MGAHNDAISLYNVYETNANIIDDPGAGGTFAIANKWGGVATIASGTRYLPNNTPVGVILLVNATGSVTIRTVAGALVASLTSGQVGLFVARSATSWASISASIPTASNISVADANSYTLQTTVEAWLSELASNQRVIEVDIARGILAAGTPLAAFADNAGAPAPGITLANSKAVGLRWNNQGTQNAPVWFNVPLPYQGFDQINQGFVPTLHVQASKVGATVGDATTFTVTAFLQSTGELHDASINVADNEVTLGVTTAMTGNAATKTLQEVTLVFDDITKGAFGKSMSLSITPTSGSLGTDDVIIHRIWFTY